MAQAGIHGLVALGVRKWTPERKWLLLGIVLGNFFPDMDNFAVAVATLTGQPSEGLHRTFTHSLFTVLAIVIVFYVLAWITKRPRLKGLGLGLGIGVLMHLALDLLVWFNGVEILWPIPSWFNLWAGVTPPVWFGKLLLPLEFLFIALFFLAMANWARQQETDTNFLPKLRVWTVVQAILFVVFLALVYTLEAGFMIPYGAAYLFSLTLAFGVAIRMRNTLEAPNQTNL